MIIELTKEQEAKADLYAAEGIRLVYKTVQNIEEFTSGTITDAVNFLYNYILQIKSTPKIHVASGPTEAKEILKKIATDDPTEANYPTYYFQNDMDWTQFYLYFVELFPKEFNSEFAQKTFAKSWVNITRSLHGAILGQNEVILIAFPKKYETDSQNRRHNFNGPAVKYLDGTKLYYIDGLKVPYFIVTTPLSAITKELVLGIENVDFRRCLIKRMGAAKTVEVLGAITLDKKTLDVGGTYELLGIEIDGEQMPYLKMINPSINEVHIEGVSADCKTIEDAIRYRNGLKVTVLPEYCS